MSARSCVIFLTGPHTSQEFISQVLSQFDANLSGDIPCCVITSTGDAPLWCGAESPGTSTNNNLEHTATWSTSLAGLKFNEEKLRAGSLDNVGITLHNLLDDLPKYTVTHAVWITEQIPTAGASLILASGLMRFIKCHHGYLSIVTQCGDTHHSPWVKAMKAAVLLKSDVHNIAQIISKCCWVSDIQFRGYQNSVDVTLTGVCVQGKHTDCVTNGNLTTLTVIQIVNTVPLYILKECVDIRVLKNDTARRLTTLSAKGLLCKVTYQKEQGIRTKSEWIKAVQSRSIGSSSNSVQGPYVLLWRGKLYTFRDVMQLPSDQKGVFINQSTTGTYAETYRRQTGDRQDTDWSQEQRLLEFFEKAGSENTKSGTFPVKIPSPRNTPAAATVPTPLDILNAYEPSAYRSQGSSTDQFSESHIAGLSFREALYLQTHGIQYFHHRGEADEKIQELQRKYVHRETYSSVSPYNIEEKPTYMKPTNKPTNKDSRFCRTNSNNSDKSGSSKGKCKASSLDRSKSLNNLAAPAPKTEQKHSKSTESLPQSTADIAPKPEPKPEPSSSKSSRSQKNKTLLKSVISECLCKEGIPPEHSSFRQLSSKLYEVCKLLLKDAVSGNQGVRDTMVAIVSPQTSVVVALERQKQDCQPPN